MIQKVEVRSSIELYDNKNDDQRVYDIESDVHISGVNVNSTDGGTVYKDGEQVATFNSWDKHLNVTYMGMGMNEQTEINEAVNDFIGEVKKDVRNE